MVYDGNESGGDPRQEIIDTITQQLSSIRRRVNELKEQITQMQSQVDREQAKYSGIAIDLRNIKDNIDTVPREDMRDKYDEALDVLRRLATMRGQLEKFEANYSFLEQQQQLLAQILGRIQGIDALPSGVESDSPSMQGAVDVIAMIRAQEDERYRLSRALHDGPAQSLTNFIIQAEICQRLFDRNPEKAAEELSNLKASASSTFQKVREFISDLRPMILDDLGVAPAVRRYVEGFGQKNDIKTSLEISGEDRHLENYREVMVFRSIQELLVMARDYASPTEVSIRLDLTGKSAKIIIEDNGRGFDTSGITDPERETNDARVQALKMLKSKFEPIGGKLEVRSTDSDGTTVRLEMPTGSN